MNQQKGACEANLGKQAPRGSLASEDVIKHIVHIWSVWHRERKSNEERGEAGTCTSQHPSAQCALTEEDTQKRIATLLPNLFNPT